MSCLSCKHTDEVLNSSPHTSKRESRWRFVAGMQSKGLEFNVQLGLVNSKLSDFRAKNLQAINNNTYNKNLSIVSSIEK